MAEQRLIDAEAFKESWKDGIIGNTMRGIIDDQPTIDPETLPIVQKLRAKVFMLETNLDELRTVLDRMTAERNAAVKDLETAMSFYYPDEAWDFLRSICAKLDENGNCKCAGGCEPTWRGYRGEEMYE